MGHAGRLGTLERKLLEIYSANVAITYETLLLKEEVEATQRELVFILGEAELIKLAALGSLVEGVAHEVNTPIGVAVTAMSHLQEELARVGTLFRDNQLKRSELEAFLSDTGRIAELLLANLYRAAELLRGFKQVAVHQSSDQLDRFDVGAEIRNILLSLNPEIRLRGVSIDLECHEGLMMRSYPGAFGQVVTNLVMNGLVHAFEEREEPGVITLGARAEGEDLVFEYKDNGVGMPEDALTRIFEPFYTTRRGRGGTGLGMHIVYNLVNFRLKGRTRAQGNPGQGLGVLIRVPLSVD